MTLFPSWWTLHGLVTAIAVLFYVISAHVMQQRRSPTAAIAWVIFILLVPYVALPIYWIFGFRKLPRPHLTPTPFATPNDFGDNWAVQTALALGQPAPSAYQQLNIHDDGENARYALFHTISNAKHSIDICTFIMKHDTLGDAVLERLCQKARDGVRVRLLLDGLGHLMGRRQKLASLTDAGGTWALFVPPMSSPLKGRVNLRNHRKLLITDAGHNGAHLWCGGRNLATEYFDSNPELRGWHDLTFDLSGSAVQQALSLFEQDWAFANNLPRPNTSRNITQQTKIRDGTQLIASGPDQADDTLHALLVSGCYHAQQRIILITPYFVPDDALLSALCLAARRGVCVDLLIPERSNHRMSDLARARALRSLARAGARIWLAPNMLHAKLAIVDSDLALIGSANIDTRSLLLNYELMFAFYNTTDVQRFADWSEKERAAMRAYVATPPGFIRDVAEGLLLWMAFQL